MGKYGRLRNSFPDKQWLGNNELHYRYCAAASDVVEFIHGRSIDQRILNLIWATTRKEPNRRGKSKKFFADRWMVCHLPSPGLKQHDTLSQHHDDRSPRELQEVPLAPNIFSYRTVLQFIGQNCNVNSLIRLLMDMRFLQNLHKTSMIQQWPDHLAKKIARDVSEKPCGYFEEHVLC